MLRVLLADDHAVVRQGLKKILGEEFQQAIFGEAQSFQEVLDLAAGGPWDVIVLDVSMPGRSGLEALEYLRRLRPAPPVLVLSMYGEAFYAVRAFQNGAAGYLTKQSAPDELVKAVRKVLTGGKYVPPALAERLASHLDAGVEKPPHENLANREYQVMCLIASGKRLTEIAAELSLSPKTVSTYRCRILEKMQMHSNGELTFYAIRNGLVAARPA